MHIVLLTMWYHFQGYTVLFHKMLAYRRHTPMNSIRLHSFLLKEDKKGSQNIIKVLMSLLNINTTKNGQLTKSILVWILLYLLGLMKWTIKLVDTNNLIHIYQLKKHFNLCNQMPVIQCCNINLTNNTSLRCTFCIGPNRNRSPTQLCMYHIHLWCTDSVSFFLIIYF